jgi:transposase
MASSGQRIAPDPANACDGDLDADLEQLIKTLKNHPHFSSKQLTVLRQVQPRPKLGRWAAELDGLLAANAAKSAREQLTLIRIFEELRGRGYDGGYDAVRRYARRWSKERGQSTAAAYVPLSFAPGEAYQFDWSHEVVLLNGVTVIVKAAHVRLCHSRMLFVRCYPRETQEMVFDAHDRAFALFKGTCGRGIYDNMKTAVETIFVGKGRLYNRRFMQMCSHYLVDPVACTPASGWEKGQVENQVGLVRERFFTPRLRFKTLDELNAWLLDKCIAYAKAHRHPELTEQTVWEVFEAERPKLVLGALRADALQVGLRQRHLGCRHPLLVAGLLAGQEVRDGIGFCLRRCGSPSTCSPRFWDRCFFRWCGWPRSVFRLPLPVFLLSRGVIRIEIGLQDATLDFLAERSASGFVPSHPKV